MKNLFAKCKLLAAFAVLGAMVSAPAMAQQLEKPVRVSPATAVDKFEKAPGLTKRPQLSKPLIQRPTMIKGVLSRPDLSRPLPKRVFKLDQATTIGPVKEAPKPVRPLQPMAIQEPAPQWPVPGQTPGVIENDSLITNQIKWNPESAKKPTVREATEVTAKPVVERVGKPVTKASMVIPMNREKVLTQRLADVSLMRDKAVANGDEAMLKQSMMQEARWEKELKSLYARQAELRARQAQQIRPETARPATNKVWSSKIDR